jgi:hypothetical protein
MAASEILGHPVVAEAAFANAARIIICHEIRMRAALERPVPSDPEWRESDPGRLETPAAEQDILAKSIG